MAIDRAAPGGHRGFPPGRLGTSGHLTALTGARTGVVWFKICPFLLATTAAALLVASFI